jgi:hypothetical protein
MVVTTDHATVVLIHWRAPFTSGAQATIPAGTILVVRYCGSTGFGTVPEDYERLEQDLVPVADSQAEKYAGYSVPIRDEEVGTWLIPCDT